MHDYFFSIEPPEAYQPGMIEVERFVNVLDGIPEWPECIEHGMSWEKCQKIERLISIERLKYILENEEFDDMERKIGEEAIAELIKGYNEMEC